MKTFSSDAQFTSLIHSVVRHKIQGTLWDLLAWLEKGGELQSVRDMLSYIRLFSDFGEAGQGRIFLNLIREHRTLRLILPEIAERFVVRGKATNTTWLEELGLHIQHLHKNEPAQAFASRGHDNNLD